MSDEQGRLARLRHHYDTTDQSLTIDRAVLETEIVVDPMVTTSLRLPKSLLDWVRGQAEDQGMKPTALLRRWVEERRHALDGGGPAAEDRLAALERRVDELAASVRADRVAEEG